MFKTILVPTDGSHLSDKAIDTAIEFAKFSSGKIIALSVAEPYPFSPMAESTMATDPSTYEENMLALAKLNVQKVADAARNAGVPCEMLTAQAFNPDEEIISAAEKYHCDAIFMASHGRSGLSRLFLGSKTQRVLAHSTIPVLVLR
ncbi:Nucleotide-binding universal stress protein, UspA family [Collimonas sp. OK242]|jgi:nucleotide-binding universal stress UspA family protein|uniref:universal stress protein n=1 Tax=Collimonas sp. OK242 TaxID=1798195 RepID=UPI0008986925|nr:universal stress protein [Collimonas sp. OK242]SDY93168.1 Nucleotide-binding universal stress protein, UspA family [Collimonas sp. OK242]